MHTCTARTIRIVVCTILVLLAAALRSQAKGLQRIRTTSRYLQSIVQRIAASNVIVYVTCERFASSTLSGRTMWAEANREARYLRVQVDCMLPSPQFVAILGHELQHVAEVADTQDVVDSRSFAKLFQAIGYLTCHAAEQFETDGAVNAGERVRQEVLYRWPVGARVVANARTGVPAQ